MGLFPAPMLLGSAVRCEVWANDAFFLRKASFAQALAAFWVVPRSTPRGASFSYRSFCLVNLAERGSRILLGAIRGPVLS